MITDYQLTEMAKALNNEADTVSNYLAVGTGSLSSFDATQTSVTGEVGSRILLTKARSGNIVTFSATRSGASVINTSTGDSITNAGTFNGASSGTVLIGEIINGVTQTTNFDVEFNIITEVKRQ